MHACQVQCNTVLVFSTLKDVSLRPSHRQHLPSQITNLGNRGRQVGARGEMRTAEDLLAVTAKLACVSCQRNDTLALSFLHCTVFAYVPRIILSYFFLPQFVPFRGPLIITNQCSAKEISLAF